MLPKELSKLVPRDHLMSETEWRSIGVQQSRGWIHYLIHEPGIHVMTYRVQTRLLLFLHSCIDFILMLLFH